MTGITLKLSVEKRLNKLLDEAIELACIGNRSVASRTIAERVYDSESELVQEVSRSFVVDRFAWLIARRRRAQREDRWGGQLVLPDPVFRDLPRRIFLRNGKCPKLGHTILTQTEEHLRLLRERFKTHPRITQFEAVVELHRKWTKLKKDHGITLDDAMRYEAEERESQ